MKITCDIKDNFLTCFDEARGMYVHRNAILENKKPKCLTYFQNRLLVLGLILLFIFFFEFYSMRYCTSTLPLICSLIGLIYFIFVIFEVSLVYFRRKKQNFKSSLKIDKDGITDESFHGIKMIFNWKKITAVVIGKHTVTILTDTPCYFFFDISKKDEIEKALIKYGKKSKIIK